MAAIPVPYVGTGANSGIVLGHFATAQLSGAIAATPTALDPHASIRWAPSASSYLLALMRLKVGWGVITAVTTAVRVAYQASIVRGFTVDYVTGSTRLNLATTARTNQMRASMSPSQMGANGPAITTTGAMSGHTNALDVAPFAIANWATSRSSQASGTVVIMQVGDAGELKTIYEWTGLGQHPVVLASNEGVVVAIVHTGWAAGTVSLYNQWEWAEILSF